VLIQEPGAPLRAAKPQPQAEPVAWQWRRKGEPWSHEYTFLSEVKATTDDSEVRALYTAPQPQASAEDVALVSDVMGLLATHADFPSAVKAWQRIRADYERMGVGRE
jgi:hypothetical protein